MLDPSVAPAVAIIGSIDATVHDSQALLVALRGRRIGDSHDACSIGDHLLDHVVERLADQILLAFDQREDGVGGLFDALDVLSVDAESLAIEATDDDHCFLLGLHLRGHRRRTDIVCWEESRRAVLLREVPPREAATGDQRRKSSKERLRLRPAAESVAS